LAINEGVDTSNVALDEERRLASHEEVKASIDGDVNSRIKRESARVEPGESAKLAGVAHEMRDKSVHEAIQTDREIGRGRTAARVSQIVDYFFYIVYGLIAFQFVLGLIGARRNNAFVELITSLSRPLLAPFEGIVPTPSTGVYRIGLSYLFALVVYVLLHLAVNGVFRIVAHRKVTV
jgi:uncharacterized protein YggT (Ycf19 family)